MAATTDISYTGLEPEWDELADRVGAPPFLRPGWVSAWWSAFGSGRLELHSTRRDGRLAAIVPIVHRRGELHAPANWHTPEFDFVAEDRAAALDLARELLDRRGRLVELRFLDTGGWAGGALTAIAATTGYRTAARTLERAPYIALDGTMVSYEAALDGSFRRELRRRRRRLAEQGNVQFEVLDGSADLGAALAEGFAVEAAGWKGDRGTAISSQPATRRFYEQIAEWAAARGWLRLAFLRLDRRALAFDFSLEDGGVHYLLKTGFDPAFRALAPGMLLRREMLGRAFDTGLGSYEFLGTNESWKLSWTRAARERVALQAFAASAGGRATWLAHQYGRPLAKRARDRVRALRAP